MTNTRQDPPLIADERPMLEAWLEFHRATLERKCEGLDSEQLARRSVEPSTLSLLGLVRHMAEVERHWFVRTLCGEDVPALWWTREHPDADFDDASAASADEALAAWRGECAAARDAAEGFQLDDTARGFRDGEHVSLRWILVHMIEEYARHNGHADLLRERIDGATGD